MRMAEGEEPTHPWQPGATSAKASTIRGSTPYFLTMPISWKGTLTQYVGRLHRDYHNKKEVIVYELR